MRNRLWLLPMLIAPVACMSPRDRARADSVQALAARQQVLMDKLTAQRDSVSTVLNDANMFIGQIDSSISRVKGLPAASRPKRKSESGLEDQIRARRDMLKRVDALVTRARETARQVAELKDQQAKLMAENGALSKANEALRDSLNAATTRIAELSASIEKQAETIATLEAKMDDLDKQLVAARSAFAKAFYVIGTEAELIKKGVVVKEGGANLLVARIPARKLPQDVFTAIDTREVHQIEVPDSTRKYQIVSRQSLDDAKVSVREGTSFRGSLEIPEADRFWAASKYLIIVQR